MDGTQGCISALTNMRKRFPQLKIILSVGGAGQGSLSYALIARNDVTRLIFARSAKLLVDMYGFDGIDSTIRLHLLSLLSLMLQQLIGNTRLTLEKERIISLFSQLSDPSFQLHSTFSPRLCPQANGLYDTSTWEWQRVFLI